MVKVRKAVIPAAGYGTGFLPATKAQPKELLPIVDKPIIQFIIEEAIESGIEEILVITGKHKRAIEDHFDSNIELEDNLESKGKLELLEIVRSTTKSNLFFVRQSYPRGLGDAIYQAKAFVNDEPFVVMLGDDILEGDIPATKELVDLYEATEQPVVGICSIEAHQADEYGIIEIDASEMSNQDLYAVKQIVEKPASDQAPSNLAIAGRYVLPAAIFDILEGLEPSTHNEVQLTDAINILNQTQPILAKRLTADRHDVGNKIGFMKMSIHYGLSHPETDKGLKEHLIQLAKELQK